MLASFVRSTVWTALFAGVFAGSSPADDMQVGFAKSDVTPDRGLRLSGYGNRKVPAEAIETKLWTRAMAIKPSDGKVCVLANADTIGFPGAVTKEIAEKIEKEFGVPRDRFVLCSTHSHTAPHLANGLTNILEVPLTEEQTAETSRYTQMLSDRVVETVGAAIKDLAPAKIFVGEGNVGFAVNRRVLKEGKWTGFGVNKEGPVDHSVPVLKVVGADGSLRGVVFNYACHCTTLGPDFNRVCGDWAGYAQEDLEDRHRGIVAISTIGCGADANPEPRGQLEMAKVHGRAMALEVSKVIAGSMKPMTAAPVTSFGYAGLPIDRPSKEELTRRLASKRTQERRHAEEMLAILERMKRLPETYPAPLQVWRFGDQMTMVFMGGEVVVDYALRLKRELKTAMPWITAYANDVYGYLASERVRNEGGYEVDGSMIYYSHPGRWSSGTEEIVIARIHDLIANPQAGQALSPQDAIKTFRLPKGFEIELVASEPLVTDPINIAFGDDGRLWVVEMGDYPRGADGKGSPGGRVKILEDVDGDGLFDKSTLFLEGLNYPTGIMPWRKGVLVTAAPQIFYAEDTSGDGKADVRKVILEGFAEANPQHRVHGFDFGLDNWVYFGGDNSGDIRSKVTGKTINISGRDARMQPDTGVFEPVTGKSQYGRHRDDWGNWFGNNNSVPLIHFVLPDRYLQRNPHAAIPSPQVVLLAPASNPPVFPASRTADRFNDVSTANRFTSACSPIIYRDELLGPDFASAAFVAEPVHNLVHRIHLKQDGVTFVGERFPADSASEFLASTDNWSRPVRVETGPDGALWVVDMYRHVIEHPEWIPEDWQKRLDLRAGSDKGRIYRVYPTGKRPGLLPVPGKATTAELVAMLESPNGPRRDTAQRLLIHRRDLEAVAALKRLAAEGKRPTARLHALCALQGLNSLDADTLRRALGDEAPLVRTHAVRLTDELFATNRAVWDEILQLTDDPDLRVRFQLALSLGEWKDTRAADALAKLAATDLEDRWMRAAVLCSAARSADRMLASLLANAKETPARAELAEQLINTAIAADPSTGLVRILTAITPQEKQPIQTWQLSALASVLDSLDRRKLKLEPLLAEQKEAEKVRPRVEQLFAEARKATPDEKADAARRVAAIGLLGRGLDQNEEDLKLLGAFLSSREAPAIRSAAIATLGSIAGDQSPTLLLAGWKGHVPSAREEILDALLSRTEWTSKLLDAVEKGEVSSLDLSAARRQTLLESKQESIRERAAKVLADSRPADRQAVLEKYATSLQYPGNVIGGAALFAKTCSVCHQFRGIGTELGPNLASLKDKSSQALLTAILDPSKAVESKYRGYTAATSDGRVLTGMIVEETASNITLVAVNGKRDVILRTDLEELSSSGKSFMPEGLEKDIDHQELAHIIAFLQSAPTEIAGLNATSELGARGLPQGRGLPRLEGLLQVTHSTGERLQKTWLGEIEMPYCEQTDGRSLVAWKTGQLPEDLDPSERVVFRLPVAMGGFDQPAGSFTLKLADKPLLDFPGSLTDAAWSTTDGSVRVWFLAMEVGKQSSAGIFSIEVPGQMLQAVGQASLSITGSASGSHRWFGVLPFEVIP